MDELEEALLLAADQDDAVRKGGGSTAGAVSRIAEILRREELLPERER